MASKSKNMNSIISLSSVSLVIISIGHALLLQHKPIVLVIQGAIEKEGFLPTSIFWYHPNFTKGDLLVIYSVYPAIWFTNAIAIESYTGFHELPHEASENDESSDKYCAEILLKNGTSFRSPSCEVKAQWMFDRKDLLREVSLKDLIIPGTHQSAAYTKSSNESLSDQSLISRWILCQKNSIKSQLMDGIRYLDLRPGYMFVEGKKKYIVTHGVFNLISMNEVVRQINEFMDVSRDIVIVSFKEFRKGFNSKRDHLDFINYLERSFEKHARPWGSWNSKLGEIFDTPDKRLILSYEHDTYASSSILWFPIPQFWHDQQTINRLHSFFDLIHRGTKALYRPYAAMMELTHSAATVIEDTFKRDMSLRHWAQKLGRYIPQWYIEEWSSTASIIAVDFYQTSGIVDLAIQLNERKFQMSSFNRSAQ